MLLITRPEPEASALGKTLQGRGYSFLSQPMLKIRFLPANNAFPSGTPTQALLATSANGVRALAQHKKSLQNECPLLAIGAATAREAERLGFSPVWSASGRAESLVELALERCEKNAGELLHICGRDISVDIVALLQEQGFSARRITLYEAIAAEHLENAVIEAVREGRIDGVLFYSKRTAQIWSNLLRAEGLEEQSRNITAYCLAQSAADAAAALPFRDILTASHPEEAQLLDLLPPLAQNPSRG